MIFSRNDCRLIADNSDFLPDILTRIEHAASEGRYEIEYTFSSKEQFDRSNMCLISLGFGQKLIDNKTSLTKIIYW